MARVAIVLMNLGGPDSLAAVEPFLFNLFSDPAIIRVPGFLRLPLGILLARRRALFLLDHGSLLRMDGVIPPRPRQPHPPSGTWKRAPD